MTVCNAQTTDKLHAEGKGEKQGKVLKITFFRFMCLYYGPWTEIDSYLHYCVFLIFFGSGKKYFPKLPYCLQIPLFSLFWQTQTKFLAKY